LQSLKRTCATRYTNNGAMHVGFYQARDNKGNSLNRSIMFVELDPDSPISTKAAFALHAMPGTKSTWTSAAKSWPSSGSTRGPDHVPRRQSLLLQGEVQRGAGPSRRDLVRRGELLHGQHGERPAAAAPRQDASTVDKAPARGQRGPPLGEGGCESRAAEANAAEAASISQISEFHAAAQVCRAFERGRCTKYHDNSL
jgi:hypothetical protein